MAKQPSRFQRVIEALQGLWDESLFKSQTRLSRAHRLVHFWMMVWKSFTRNRCPAHASALAYGTLLALIPTLAVAMSITSSLLKREGEDRIDQFIGKLVAGITPPAVISTNPPALSTVPPTPPGVEDLADRSTNAAPDTTIGAPDTQAGAATASSTEEVVRARKEVARRIHEFIQNTRSGTLGVVGSILVIFAAISMLTRIETTFNDIWGVTRGRSWLMRVFLYWGVLTLAPILLIAVLGVASSPHFAGAKTLLGTIPHVPGLISQALPLAMLCLTFSLFYILMPNAKVRWRAALVGGLTSGLILHLNNVMSSLYVSRVVSNSKIYGSVGLIPVLMIGMYFFWWILLFGAQVSYAWQNRAAYVEEKQLENINQRGREFIALRLMACIGRSFALGEPPLATVNLAENLAVPSRLVRQILQTLTASRLVVETAGPETAYIPARPLENITCHDILRAMRASHGQELATRDEPARKEVYGEFHRIEEAEREAASSVTLLALVNRTEGARQITE
jgi:membrane protein